MAYFNHAFHKVFIGTQISGQGAGQNPNTNLDDGFIIVGNIPSSVLSVTSATAGNNYGVGAFGFFNPKNGYKSVIPADVDSAGECCPLVLASTALYQNDKVGPFHGGYQESVKSKLINPKFIRRFYRVDPGAAQNHVINIGTTPCALGVLTSVIGVAGTTYNNGTYTNVPTTGGTGTGATFDITVAGGIMTVVTINNPGINYTAADSLTPSAAIGAGDGAARITVSTVSTTCAGCSFTFMCDETYYLRLDIKGGPALGFANRNLYKTLDAYTGCCAVPATPTAVDSTTVMILWANQIVNDPILSQFIKPVVVDELGVTYSTAAAWNAYVPTTHVVGASAGIILYGAYVTTTFGDCSFQPSDGFEKEPIKILASMVDETGDPCKFTGICVEEECTPRIGQGYGETILRELILSESYMQNHFHTDIRIREITQGTDLFTAINRALTYTKYYILHSVPRYNNPTGVFDNDQYLLELVTAGTHSTFETFMSTWLGNCNDCTALEVDTLSAACTPMVAQPV